MDKKQELEKLIEKYEIVRECAEERLNEYNIQLKQLAEAEKPKLRHGDYCQAPDKKKTYVALYSRNESYEFEIWGVNDYGVYKKENVGKDSAHYTPTGQSIFDDLKALKPLKEFEVNGDIETRIDGAGLLWIGKINTFCLGNAEDYCLKLRRYIATLKSK